jgi:adenosine deaminase
MDMEWVRRLPKAELHVHIEGTLEPDMVFAMAQRNGVKLPWDTPKALASAYQFTDLSNFLFLYYQAMDVLRTREDFTQLALAYLDRAWAQGVRHAELSFDPQAHLDRGVAYHDVLDGLLDAIHIATEERDMSAGLILCFLRDKGPEEALKMLEIAAPRAGELLGIGLDSTEVGYPPRDFVKVYDRARELGLRTTAHLGEEGPAEYVRQGLAALKTERIDHGYHGLDDPVLASRIAKGGYGVTCCPLSNLRLKGVAAMTDQALPKMLAAGWRASVNSDDPAYFGGYVQQNLEAVTAAFDLSEPTIVQLCANSIETSFASPHRISELLTALDAAAEGHRH